MWTYPPRRILAAIDFGEASSHALGLAGDLARAYGATLVALHAETFDAPPYFTTDQVRTIERQRRAARTEASAYLLRFCGRLTRTPVSTSVSDAPPADAILEASRSHDLIVMGTHGRRGPPRWWAGSVAERVVRDAKVPVLVVRSSAAPAGRPFSRIAVIAGRDTFDGPARRYARGLAAQFEGEVSRTLTTSSKSTAIDTATFIVIAKPSARGGLGVASAAAEHAVRTCRRPVLFVPPV
jgi:nucleotide-binding universal stress UspA family protein